MSKKNLIILISFFVVVIFLVFFYLYKKSRPNPVKTKEEQSETIRKELEAFKPDPKTIKDPEIVKKELQSATSPTREDAPSREDLYKSLVDVPDNP